MEATEDPRNHPLWKRWHATYERHNFGAAGWATLGAEMQNGMCMCSVCRLVRPAVAEPVTEPTKK